MAKRHPMTPAEFDAASRELVRQCPWLWETSWYRNEKHNADIGGSPESKHLIGMARDYLADSAQAMTQAEAVARRLGMWAVVHESEYFSMHLHTQGLPLGDPPDWWTEKYGRGVRL